MCEFDQGFVLCTCEGELGDPQPGELRWALRRHLGPKDRMELEMGRYRFPHPRLSHLTEEEVFMVLNTTEAFDFDYTPAEGDELRIQEWMAAGERCLPLAYMSFLYSGGEWEPGFHMEYDQRLELLGRGGLRAR